MCGDLKPGQYARRICVKLNANENRAKVQIGANLEHVREVWLTEYMIVAPTIGATNLWNLNLPGTFPSDQVNNTSAQGHCLVVDDPVITHHEFNKPHILSQQHHLGIQSITVELNDSAGVPVQFTEAVFYITFVCQMANWSPDRVMASRFADPFNALRHESHPSEVGPDRTTLQRMFQ